MIINELEKKLLASLIIDKTAFRKISYLSSEEFNNRYYAEIYTLIVEENKKNKDADLVIIQSKMKNKLNHQEMANLLTTDVFSSNRIEDYAKEIKKHYQRRLFEKEISKIKEDTVDYDLILKIKEIKEKIEGYEIPKDLVKGFDSIMYNAIDEIEKTLSGEIKPFQTGYQKLDRYMKINKGSLTVFAAQSGVGKSAFMLNIVITLLRLKYEVMLFSLEMTENEVAKRFISIVKQIDLNNKYKMQDSLADLLLLVDKLRNIKFHVIDKPSSIKDIVYYLQTYPKTEILIVDYLQLIKPFDQKSIRENQVAQIVRDLKNIAQEKKIAVIALSQLNRAVDDKPVLKNLRESGEIEHSADNVVFIYSNDDKEKLEMETKLSIAKQRGGRCGTIDFLFNKPILTFTEKEDSSNYFKKTYGDKDE